MSNESTKILWLLRMFARTSLIGGFILMWPAANLFAGISETSHRSSDRHKTGWRLVWQDEFAGQTLASGNWSHEVNCAGGGNNEQQCYTDRPENSFVEDGKLHLVAKEESFSGPARFDDDPEYDPADISRTLPFTSARLRTKNKFDFKYGRVEIRAKLVSGQGMWPAFWMLPTDNVYGGWPSSGEIDIMEAVNLGVWENAVHGTLHYGLKWPQWENHGQTFALAENPSDDYHEYAIEWEEDEIRWYVDGRHYQTQTSDGWYNYLFESQKKGFQVPNKRAPFDQNFHIILNLAVGGDWPGAPDIGWLEDRAIQVDYVRVYQCEKGRGQGSRGRHKGGCAAVDESIEVNADLGKPATNKFLIFKNGVEALELELNENTVSNTVVAGFWELDPGNVISSQIDIGGRWGEVWDVSFNGAGNIFLTAQDTEDDPDLERGVSLVGGSGWTTYGEIAFKMKIVDASADSQFTVKLDSGWPNLGEVTIDTPPVGKWRSVKVRMSELISNPNPAGAGVDLDNVQNLFVMEYSGTSANVQVDNIRLTCAVNSEPEVWQQDQLCSMAPRIARFVPIGDTLDIYSDSITHWNVFDCCGGVTISQLSDNGNNVLQFAYDNDPNSNTVSYFQSASPIDLSSFAGGKLEFDMLVETPPTVPAAEPWFMKVDCIYPCSSGDVPLSASVEGVNPTTGVWQHYTFELNDLTSRGVNLSSVDSPLVIFPAWGNQDGAIFRIDNVTWSQSDGVIVDPNPTVPVDFEDTGLSYNFSNFEGAVASVLANPNVSDDNKSARVGKMVKFTGAVYAGSTLSLAEDVDFSSGTQLKMKVMASRAVPVLLKLEGLNVEVTANHSGSGEWEELIFDFVGQAGSGVNAITLIFDLGISGDAATNPEDWTFYFDDITL